MKKLTLFKSILYLVVGVGLLIGEIRCIYKLVTCDFKPSYKAEVLYGVGSITGLGCIMGWIDLGK